MANKAAQIRDELLTIKNASRDRMLHAEKVVAWAKSHRDSALHSQFEWNNSKAATEFRLEQARRLIRITVVSEDGTPQLVSLSTDRSKGGGYREITEVARNRKLSEIMLEDAIKEMRRVQARFGRVRQLTAVWKAFDKIAARAEAKTAKQAAKLPKAA